ELRLAHFLETLQKRWLKPGPDLALEPYAGRLGILSPIAAVEQIRVAPALGLDPFGRRQVGETRGHPIERAAHVPVLPGPGREAASRTDPHHSFLEIGSSGRVGRRRFRLASLPLPARALSLHGGVYGGVWRGWVTPGVTLICRRCHPWGVSGVTLVVALK